MIFGDIRHFAVELSPLNPGWERHSPMDRGPWARFSLWSTGNNLTKGIAPGGDHVLTGIEIPLLPVADWFVRNAPAILFEEFPHAFPEDLILHGALLEWNEREPPAGFGEEEYEDARYEWYERHFLLSGAEGALLPDLAFARIDERLYLSWRQPHFAGPRSLQFLHAEGITHHPWEPAWNALREFVRYVAGEALRAGVTTLPWLHADDPLGEASRLSPQEYVRLVHPELANGVDRLGVDPHSQPDEDPALLALRDMSLSGDGTEVINGLAAIRRPSSVPSDSELANLRGHMGACAGRPEEDGQSGARLFREERGLNGQPLPTEKLEGLLDRLADVESMECRQTLNNFALGGRRGGKPRVALFKHQRTEREWARRMELARAIGHLLLDAETRFGVFGAGSSHSARGPRRRRSGAFAAELLLPTSGLHQFLAGRNPSDPQVFEELLEHFQVGARTAAYHLWNQRLLGSLADRDALVDEFGWKQQSGQTHQDSHR